MGRWWVLGLIAAALVGSRMQLLRRQNREMAARIVALSRTTPVATPVVIDPAHAPPTPKDLELFRPADADYLKGVLARITGGEKLSQEELCVRVTRYVCSHIAVGSVEPLLSPRWHIENQAASCGGFAMTFSDLVRVAGIPARYVGVFGLPNAGSHALAEAYYDGAWHLFDATFAVIFYSRPTYDGKGKVLSTKEILTAPVMPTMMKVVSKPWLKNFDRERSHGVLPITGKPEWHVDLYWNEAARRVAFPIAYGNDSKVAFPVRVDLNAAPSLAFGAVDGSWRDVYLQSAVDPTIGYFYAGGTTPTAQLALDLRAPARSYLELTWTTCGTEPGELELFPTAGLHVLERRRDGLKTTFRVLMLEERAAALLKAPHRLAFLDAASFRRVDG